MERSAPVRSSKPAIVFILFTLLLDVLGFGLLIPVAPRLVQSLLNGGQGGSEEQAARIVGYLVATYAAMQFCFAPALGALSDRFGRRAVLLIAIFGSGLDYFAMALSPTLAILFFTRAINGLSGASLTVVNAYIADTTTPEKRAAAFGMIGAAFGLGFVLGPLLGGWLGEINIRLPFYVAGSLSLLNWLYGLLVLPESLGKDLRTRFNPAKANPFGAFAGLGRYPLVAELAGAMFLFHTAMFGLHATWVLYTQHRYHWSSDDVGYSLALVGIGAAVVQAGLAGRIIGAIGERRAVLLGVAIGVLSYIGYGAAPTGTILYLVIVFAAFGGIAQPAIQSLITRTVAPTEQGFIQGGLTAIQCVANIIGPLIGSQVFAYFISARAPFQLPGASFFVGAFLVAIGWVLAAHATRPENLQHLR
jgi:DHA1 family tetracycline resistance protein-like MFS transporter